MTEIQRARRTIDGQRGFALIEVLIASAVIALVLGALVAGVTGALRSDRHAETRQRALLVAQSKLEAVGIAEPLQAGTREGDVAGLHWKQVSTRLAPGSNNAKRQVTATQAQPVSPPALDLFWVELSISGGDGTRLTLAGLKIAAAK